MTNKEPINEVSETAEPVLPATIISRTGTRHIVGRPGGIVTAHAFRTTTLCGYGVRPEEALTEAEAVSDCQFCLEEEALRQREKEALRARLEAADALAKEKTA
jgi:hypothetical protein